MRPTLSVCSVTLILGLVLAACGNDTEPEPATTDNSDASSPEDASDTVDPIDETDAANTSDPSNDSDPSQEPEPEGTDCKTYLECVDNCWLDAPETAEACSDECADDATPEALEAGTTYYECMDDCEDEHTDNDDLSACYEDECSSLYNLCKAPPECIVGCDHYDEICGDEGPLNRRATYFAGGQHHTLHALKDQLVVRFDPNLLYTPQVPGVSQIETFRSLDRKGLKILHLDEKANKARTEKHPSIARSFTVYESARRHRLIGTDEIVASAPGVSLTELNVILADAKVQIIRPVRGLGGTWLLRSLDTSGVEAATRLNQSQRVAWASPNFFRQYQLKYTPNDPYFPNQWHHRNTGERDRTTAGNDMRTPAAWEQTQGSPEVILAINDDGVDLRHDDIRFTRDESGNLVGVNLPEDIDTSLAEGCCQHGTSVSGVASAIADNEIGTVGVCPGCSVLPVWTDYSSPNDDVAVAETFTESTENDAWVINNSWGPPDGNPAVIEAPAPFEPLPDVVAQAIQDTVTNGRGGKGTPVLFAAGNGNEDVASDAFVTHPNVIAVAAVNANGVKSSYSDFGNSVWVSAPSSGNFLMPGIVTTDALGEFGYNAPGMSDALDPTGDVTHDFGGTSSATPAVTGVIGLMLSANPELHAGQVKDILRRTSRKIDRLNGRYQADFEGFLRSPFYGYGLVDAHAAVRAAAIGCQSGNTNSCVPLSDCTDGPMANVAEICNGVDDNCDGTIDEEACPVNAEIGSTCDMTGSCGENCSWLKEDPHPACLASCETDTGCDNGQVCQGGLCKPESERLSPATEEVCDGYDNDLDGEIDEMGCELSEDATCEFTQQCDNSNGDTICVEGFCAPTCDTTEDCETGVECQAIATQYGESADDSICAPSLDTGLTCLEACMFLEENAPGPIFEGIVNCITEAPTCDEAIACVPL